MRWPAFKDYTTFYLVLITVPVLIGLNIFVIYNYFTFQTETETLASEVEKLQNSLTTLNENKTKIGDDMDSFNTILGSLIPNKEDYFTIIVALEKLSQVTNFSIVRYEILLSKSTPDKLALTIEGDGDVQAFYAFLEEYPFTGGRLITNEKMEYSNDTAGRIKLDLNFYHRAISPETEGIKPISNADINLMKKIQEKVVIAVKREETEIEIEPYETKENPF